MKLRWELLPGGVPLCCLLLGAQNTAARPAANYETAVERYTALTKVANGGESRSSVLTAAQLELLESDYAHPFYWAGLSLHGAGGPLAFAQPPIEVDDGTLPWWGFLIVALLVIGLLGYFLKFLHQGLPVPPEEEGPE
ncbi:hypothetical protein [Neolewinella sp.]|uniref:hypothetical protein n=1 Tax=Neolewinella sp. TaxID=2993543 RepID=UPI003B52F987